MQNPFFPPSILALTLPHFIVSDDVLSYITLDGDYVHPGGVDPHILDNLPRIIQRNQPTPLADPPDQGQGQLLEGARRKQVQSRV